VEDSSDMAPFITRLGNGGLGSPFGFGKRKGDATPTYLISASTTSVNEGSNVTFTVTTTNVPSGTTLYWSTNTISGTINGSDFSDAATTGSFTISSNSGSVVRTLANDFTTEGTESFQLQIRTESISGTIVATSATVTINDTSIPIPPSLISYIIVGGGGSGGLDNRGGGGGGAGGAITGTVPVSSGTSYTISVGGGGSPTTAFGLQAYAGGPGQGVPGNPSNASGGGGNGDSPNSDYFKGGNGGPQGNPGGSGNHGHNNPYQGSGGGGGGAGGAGGSVPLGGATSSSGGSGGSGVNRSINGFSGNFSGGGGGGSDASGPGSPGGSGGGYGGYGPNGRAGQYFQGGNGGANTGGGGGGNGGSGGSGKVVISYPDSNAIATSTTGTSSPGAGSGGYRVYVWDGSGSITF